MRSVSEENQSEEQLPSGIDRAARLAAYLRAAGTNIGRDDTGAMPALRPRRTPSSEDGRPTIMVVAFEGWNDAGGAATSAVRALSQTFDAELLERLEDENYYDYQFTRPKIRKTGTGSQRELIWPSTKFYRAVPASGEFELLLVQGVEPSFRWQAFTADLLTRAAEQHVSGVVLVGALLADVPHSRPIPASFSSEDEHLQDILEIDEPTYEGPTGIVGVLAHTAFHAGIPAVSLWAAVPHYVGQAPSPKAQLALMRQLEDVLGLTLEVEEVAEDADAWERGVDDLAQEDEEIADYVKRLEEATDTTSLPEASGEAIAQEFERYLRRRKPPEQG